MKHRTIILLIGIISLSAFNSQSIAKDRGFFGNLRRMIFPPRDLYELIAKTEIDVTEAYKETWAKFRIKYDGPYSFGIILEHFSGEDSGDWEKKNIGLVFRIEFFENDKSIYTIETCGKKPSPFLGLRGNGYSFGTFDTPEQIPIKKEIECKVTILKPDELLCTEYGSVWFYIKKISEK